VLKEPLSKRQQSDVKIAAIEAVDADREPVNPVFAAGLNLIRSDTVRDDI
jgi:hypothetical protein